MVKSGMEDMLSGETYRTAYFQVSSLLTHKERSGLFRVSYILIVGASVIVSIFTHLSFAL